MNQKIKELSRWMKDQGIDLALLTSPANILYLTRFHCDPHERLLALFVPAEEEPFLICPLLEVQRAKEAGWKGEVLGYGDAEDPWDRIRERWNRAAGTIAVEKEHLTFGRAERLLALNPDATLVSVEEKMYELRAIKDEEEIRRLAKAARLADYGVEIGIDALREGCTEIEIVAEIEYELKKKGVQGMSFSTTVLFGENTALPHGTPGSRKLSPGDLVLFDLGVIVDGYCSDITRTVAYRQIDDQCRQIYETVLRAQQAALGRCSPGIPISEVDQAARKVITAAGYGDRFPHRVGHGLGLEVHEFPSMSASNDQTLREGMTFTVEPGIYIPGKGGVRIEDDVVITRDGCEILTKFPKELRVVE
ncbi:Xaa-Pro aminopeptidase. Metallo peptidase. MEROPS family M24B [Planifilum fulgidum]|jgi:Xaa-Pro dipeptidase|uniref:Xaa-Pro aminopeptidase. Metallo peptidase. MEROPS family M24B n=1 Tax=Planifilum fulgidum TaxID=201973 RepID=A0A1I2NHH8_9BACL|nr:Xaa-Pro peptidase family protein [Planifilum fulgidum]SFG00761.1 Xaa-Pro aminopeptidase. Metallo peptidase. MEROPS family M24B [Planifilum fulgidum]